GSNGADVVIYKGINGTVLGVKYSSPIRDTGIAMASLPSFERERVADTIGAGSRRDAERIVSQLHPSPAPPASSSPSGAPPSASPSTAANTATTGPASTP